MFQWIGEYYHIDLYQFIGLFASYSILGWLVESIYMSFCNRKITNRGFGKGPFCPIYGVGAMGAFFLFTPLWGRYVLIYVLACLVATVFEYITGRLMIFLLGDLWWDYSEKPFNFQGIICLESTLAWGVYALIIVHVLNGRLLHMINHIDRRMGWLILGVIFFLVLVDYLVQIGRIFHWPMKLSFGRKIVRKVKRTIVNTAAEAKSALGLEMEGAGEQPRTDGDNGEA